MALAEDPGDHPPRAARALVPPFCAGACAASPRAAGAPSLRPLRGAHKALSWTHPWCPQGRHDIAVPSLPKARSRRRRRATARLSTCSVAWRGRCGRCTQRRRRGAASQCGRRGQRGQRGERVELRASSAGLVAHAVSVHAAKRRPACGVRRARLYVFDKQQQPPPVAWAGRRRPDRSRSRGLDARSCAVGYCRRVVAHGLTFLRGRGRAAVVASLCTCAGGVRRPTCSPPGMMLALCARFEEEPYPTAPMGVSPPIGLTNHGEVQPLGLLCVGC
jgi:hypothetical protein